MADLLTNQEFLNLLIVSKVYVERTLPLLEPGVGLITDPKPKQEDAKLIAKELRVAIYTIQHKIKLDRGKNWR